MSFLGFYVLREAGAGLVNRVVAGVAELRRVTAAVALLRLLVAGSLVGASALAIPLSVTLSRSFLAFVALGIVAALLPRTHAVAVALLVVAVGLALEEPPLWRVLGVATLLYLAHASAALAAVVPHDCAVAPSALRAWARRTASVLLASLGISSAGLVLTGNLPLTPGVVGPIVGSVIAAAIALILAWLAPRPSP